jgi:hypothetical protein
LNNRISLLLWVRDQVSFVSFSLSIVSVTRILSLNRIESNLCLPRPKRDNEATKHGQTNIMPSIR